MISRICLVLLLALPASFAEVVECPNIIKRDEWTSVPRRGDFNTLDLPLPYVIISKEVTEDCDSLETCINSVEGIRRYHMDLSFTPQGDITNSFLIGGDGNVYEGRGWLREGAHTRGYNNRSIGIAFIKKFGGVSQLMLDTAHQLIKCGKSKGFLLKSVRVLYQDQVVNSWNYENSPLYKQIQNWPEFSSEP